MREIRAIRDEIIEGLCDGGMKLSKAVDLVGDLIEAASVPKVLRSYHAEPVAKISHDFGPRVTPAEVEKIQSGHRGSPRRVFCDGMRYRYFDSNRELHCACGYPLSSGLQAHSVPLSSPLAWRYTCPHCDARLVDSVLRDGTPTWRCMSCPVGYWIRA